MTRFTDNPLEEVVTGRPTAASAEFTFAEWDAFYSRAEHVPSKAEIAQGMVLELLRCEKKKAKRLEVIKDRMALAGVGPLQIRDAIGKLQKRGAVRTQRAAHDNGVVHISIVPESKREQVRAFYLARSAERGERKWAKKDARMRSERRREKQAAAA